MGFAEDHKTGTNDASHSLSYLNSSKKTYQTDVPESRYDSFETRFSKSNANKAPKNIQSQWLTNTSTEEVERRKKSLENKEAAIKAAVDKEKAEKIKNEEIHKKQLADAEKENKISLKRRKRFKSGLIREKRKRLRRKWKMKRKKKRKLRKKQLR